MQVAFALLCQDIKKSQTACFRVLRLFQSSAASKPRNNFPIDVRAADILRFFCTSRVPAQRPIPIVPRWVAEERNPPFMFCPIESQAGAVRKSDSYAVQISSNVRVRPIDADPSSRLAEWSEKPDPILS